jgi:putative ABC transport system permease protein
VSIAWRKVWRDLWNNKFRTVLVVLSTAVGVFALGLVFGMSGVMRARMTGSHQASNAPHIEMYTSLFGQDVIETVLREPGVAYVEGEVRDSFRWKFPGEDEWRSGTIIARGDYGKQSMYPIELLEGEWPDGRAIAVERMSESHFGLPVGTTIIVEYGRHERTLTIESVVRHPYTPPPQLSMGDATFCASIETLAWLFDRDEGYNTLNIQLESFSQEKAEETAERIQERLEGIGMGVGFWDIVDPEVHWAQEMMDGIFLILGVLGVLALGLSGFLVINTMNAVVSQQVWQIGVMKAVGATRGRVLRLYLTTALVYGSLALFVAVPLGAVGAHLMAAWMLDFFNILAGDFRIIESAVVIQIIVGLIVPLLAALVPVLAGAHISAHKAISSYGIAGGFGRGLLDRILGRVRHLPRPMALSMRNTFRRKARVAMTLLSLSLGGVIFILVMTIGDSFTNTLDVLLSDFGFDVLVVFDRTYRMERLIEATESVPGVTYVEVWDVRGGATLELDNGEEIQGQLWGVPDNSKMFNPRIIAGRALEPNDGNAILLNSKIAADHGFEVGDEVTITVDGEEITWTVVGLVVNINNNQHDNFVPFDAMAQAIGNANRGAFLMANSAEHTSEAQARLIEEMRVVYEAHRLKPVFFQSAAETREQGEAQFETIVYLMLAMALLAAAVGGIGLMGTMSINVVERGREIGVMRSIGATSLSVAGIFVVEGMFVGALSWLIAVPVSYPGALAFSNVVGNAILELPLDFKFSIDGVVLWLGIVLFLSAIASLWPALRATRVSVREALAYE